MSDLTSLSRSLGSNERTLRRAAHLGLIKGDRRSERRLHLSLAEQRYLKDRWTLLSGLRQALRTERNVRLAILFGSVARGDEQAKSDVDVLVDLCDSDRFRLLELEERLSLAVGREVQLLRLADAQRDPALLGEALTDGRVLLDRDGQWAALEKLAPALQQQGEQQLDTRARKALDRARQAVS